MTIKSIEIIISLGSVFSTLGCLSIILSYFLYPALRNLFYRITLYRSVVQSMQAVGLLLISLQGFTAIIILVSDYRECKYFATIRIFGAASSVIFSIIQLHQLRSVVNQYRKHNTKLQIVIVKSYKGFERDEVLYIILGFLVPIFLSQLPYWENLIIESEDICYLFSYQNLTEAHNILTILSSILCWDGLIILYIAYFINTAFQLANIHDDYETYEAVKILKRTLYVIVTITLSATIPFTFTDILELAYVPIPAWVMGFCLILLSFWGFADSLNIWLTNPHLREKILKGLGITKESDYQNQTELERSSGNNKTFSASVTQFDGLDTTQVQYDLNKLMYSTK